MLIQSRAAVVKLYTDLWTPVDFEVSAPEDVVTLNLASTKSMRPKSPSVLKYVLSVR